MAAPEPQNRHWPELLLALALLLLAFFGLNRHLTQLVVKQEGVVAQRLLQGVFLAQEGGAGLFQEPAPTAELQAFIRQANAISGMVRFNIYSPDGVIRYSSEDNLTGLKFSDNAELEKVLLGDVAVSLEPIGAKDKSEHLALRSFGGDRLLEAYIPVTGKSGAVAAVVEFYKKPQELEEILRSLSLALWISGLVVVAGVLLLWWRMARA